MTQGVTPRIAAARWWLFPVACLLGLVAGWFLALRFGTAPGTGDAAASSPPGTVSSGPGAITLDDLRRVVREEIAIAGRVTPVGQSQSTQSLLPSSTPEVPERTAAQVSAQQQATQLIDSAINRRQWTSDDVDAMQGLFHQLTPGQQAEVLQQYAVAVNQGRLVPQTDRIPF